MVLAFTVLNCFRDQIGLHSPYIIARKTRAAISYLNFTRDHPLAPHNWEPMRDMRATAKSMRVQAYRGKHPRQAQAGEAGEPFRLLE